MRITIKKRLLTEAIDPDQYTIDYISRITGDQPTHDQDQPLDAPPWYPNDIQDHYVLSDVARIFKITAERWKYGDWLPSGDEWVWSFHYNLEFYHNKFSFAEKNLYAGLAAMFFETVIAHVRDKHGDRFVMVANTTPEVHKLIDYAEKKSLLRAIDVDDNIRLLEITDVPQIKFKMNNH